MAERVAQRVGRDARPSRAPKPALSRLSEVALFLIGLVVAPIVYSVPFFIAVIVGLRSSDVVGAAVGFKPGLLVGEALFWLITIMPPLMFTLWIWRAKRPIAYGVIAGIILTLPVFIAATGAFWFFAVGEFLRLFSPN